MQRQITAVVIFVSHLVALVVPLKWHSGAQTSPNGFPSGDVGPYAQRALGGAALIVRANKCKHVTVRGYFPSLQIIDRAVKDEEQPRRGAAGGWDFPCRVYKYACVV